MSPDFNAELHARPSIYFSAPALVEHFALMPQLGDPQTSEHSTRSERSADGTQVKVERHTEFVTVTRVAPLAERPTEWPVATLAQRDAERRAGLGDCRLVLRIAMLVLEPTPPGFGEALDRFDMGASAGSQIGGRDAQVFTDFKVREDGSCRMLLFNEDLNAYRLGRMVRRLCEIETYRVMALLGLSDARSLGSELVGYDADLLTLSSRNLAVEGDGHRALLDDLSRLSALVVSAAARTRHRFGATSAYAKIVEERIGELREERVPGYQRYGVFVARRFKPAVRTCQATALRLEQISRAATLLIDLLQTRMQVEAQANTGLQMRLMAERTAVQLKIQRAVEGFSIIAITYYLVALAKTATEASSHAGYELDPRFSLAFIPVCLCAVALAVSRVKRALSE